MFRLKSSHDAIAGVGFFVYFSTFPYWLVHDAMERIAGTGSG